MRRGAYRLPHSAFGELSRHIVLPKTAHPLFALCAPPQTVKATYHLPLSIMSYRAAVPKQAWSFYNFHDWQRWRTRGNKRRSHLKS